MKTPKIRKEVLGGGIKGWCDHGHATIFLCLHPDFGIGHWLSLNLTYMSTEYPGEYSMDLPGHVVIVNTNWSPVVVHTNQNPNPASTTLSLYTSNFL